MSLSKNFLVGSNSNALAPRWLGNRSGISGSVAGLGDRRSLARVNYLCGKSCFAYATRGASATTKTDAFPASDSLKRFNSSASGSALALDNESADLDGALLRKADEIADSPHFTVRGQTIEDVRLPHPVWSRAEMEGCAITHLIPKGFLDTSAYYTVRFLRNVYDIATGYTFGKQDEACMVRRLIFLETVAGVPGMVAGMIRHLRSLRRMERDYGWIHTLLEEAENERMHLMTALLLRKPSWMIRAAVIGAQGGFLAWYTTMYILSPKYCHRFVGYLEEEAVKTYTSLVDKIDDGKLPGFKVPAPRASRAYYRLPEGVPLRDVFLSMRADEGHHREVNHTLASLKPDSVNPFPPGY